MDEQTVAAGDLGLELDSVPRINYAMHQNAAPLVRGLVVRNTGDRPLEGLLVGVSSQAPAVGSWETRVERLDPGDVYRCERPPVRLDRDVLANQDEREVFELVAAVRQNGSVLAEVRRPLEVLAYNEWAGVGVLPELLAAFVQPNHPDLQPLLGKVRDHLRTWTRDPALAGYQRPDPARVRLTVAAVYQTIQDLDITYVNPPASFEARGQKIRTVEDVLRTRMGTCLDLAALSAALLEQAGLNPLVPIIPGHAFAGCWLAGETVPDVVHDDAARIRNGVRLGELLLFDPALATHRPALASFERAERVGAELVGADSAAPTRSFVCVVDVRAARVIGVQPLPARKSTAAYEVPLTPTAPVAPDVAPGGSAELSVLVERAVNADARQRATDEPSRDRIDRWKTQLLDLSRRNRLLHFRETVQTLELLAPNLAELEDRLAAGEAFTVRSRPEHLVVSDAEGDGSEPGALDRFLQTELGARRLCAPYSQRETDKKLLTIFRTARTNRQESGASMLFLAFGFLRWCEDERGTVERLAPVLLLPLELRRENAGAPFHLGLADDEARLNTTLLEMLRKEHGLEVRGLDPPPEDASGLDIDQIFTQFRRAVKHKRGWEVVERAFVGLFSFTKFLMWNDLEARKEEIFAHPVVRHLAGEGVLDADSAGAFPAPRSLDEVLHPADTYCPLDADSSQLVAVLAAAGGRTFVLEGPPGTGKSQTITNLIAQCLANGKTVLFVSEKLAALEVVERRLGAIGLGPHCLELHSSKAQKRAVVEQLAAALAAGRPAGNANWRERGDALRGVRSALNRYVEAIHRPRALGRTVFEVTSDLIALRDAPLVRLNLGAAERLDAARWRAQLEHADRLATALGAVGAVRLHPFRAVRRDDVPPTELAELGPRLAGLREAADRLRQAADTVRDALHLGALPDDRRGTSLLLELAALLAAAPGVTGALLDEPGWTALREEVDGWASHGRARGEAWSPLADAWGAALLELPLERLQARFARWAHLFFLFAFFLLWGARRELKPASRSGRVPPSRDVPAVLERAREVRREDEFLAGIDEEARRLFGRRWRGAETDWAGLMNDLAWTERFRQAVGSLADLAPELSAARGRLVSLASTDVERLDRSTELGATIGALLARAREFDTAKAAVVSSLDLDETIAWGDEGGPGFLGHVAERCAEWETRQTALRDWLLYARARERACAAELREFVAALDDGRVGPADVVPAFRRSVLQWWLDATAGDEDVLRRFHGAEHVRKVEQFRRIDAESLALAATETCARAAAGVPEANGAVARSSALGILQNEIHKRKRHLAIRRLFEQTGDLIPRLTPCILMSPLSVAQYLDPKLPPFDVVVFDEASQVPVWDAIGAIARGKQLVVVGDPKQLPPTSFFQRGETDDAPSEDDIVDHESILDECLAAGLPRLRLGWHYRSRHEHLIAFSNHHYYGDELLTFPSADEHGKGLGVSWRHVPGGVYDKGNSRTNRAEADAVVAEIVRRLRDAALQERTIGVVTFAQAQQTLIENLLDGERRKHPDIERFFDDDGIEPVFVKNLENVQGDERDTILFSVCYGPDPEGRVSLNFGPLNRKGGERRLNVAITRARRELVVFSTLRSEQIDLNRTSAAGVAHLKSFLSYADRGPSAIAEATTARAAVQRDAPFEADVCAALRARGFLVDAQVGCSGYRIDLGVRHPDEPGRYVIGVECDGRTYQSAATARDRDRLRQSVLEGLGWRVTRVWSADWFQDRANQLDRLTHVIEDAIRDAASAPDAPPRPEPPARPARAPDPDAAAESAVERVRAALREEPGDSADLPGARPYGVHVIEGVGGSADDFELPQEDAAVREALVQLVRHEGPVHVDVAARRVGERWGKMRLSNLVRRRVLGALQGASDREIQRLGEFLWPELQDPAAWEGFRVPDGGGDASRRAAEEIPPEELANAMRALLERNIHLPEDDLLRETARVFGIARLGSNVRDHLAVGLALLEQQRRCVRDGADVRLP